ncbi:MAG: BamA/TamA family outer membrane protein [Acidobacteriota bacterium]|nr:BamA/TamA family outer membrane protein [Acidobacteriota bacterium]
MSSLNALYRLAAGLLLALAPAVSFAATDTPPASSKKTIIVIPMAYFTPETSLAGGIGGLLAGRFSGSDRTTRPSSVLFSAVYTLKNQFTIQMKPEIYLKNEAWVINGNAEWSRFPTPFFGLGNEAPEEASETMTPIQILTEVQVLKRIVPRWKLYAGVMGVYESYSFRAFASGGLLASGDYRGSEGGALAGFGVTARTDSRDNVFSPRRGRFWQASAVFHGGFLGGDYRFTKIKADLRSYVPFASSAVLGFQIKLETASGDVPFMALPKLGGDSLMRGYLKGRYCDRVFAGFQAEARVPISGRFGAAVFAGLGEVAGSPGRLSLAGLKPSLGAGLRVRITDEGNTLRLDYGFGRRSTGFYVTVNEAF